MAAKIIATVESARAGAALAPAVVEIDEMVPVFIDGAVLYAREIRVEPIEPEWEIELA
jgi:nicotinamide mononucleotide (NMN) deamidase PncC